MLPLTKELLSSEPEALAKSLSAQETKKSEQQVTNSQARKFYDDFLLLQKKARRCKDEEEFKEKILPLVAFSKAKLAYAVSRSTIKPSFRDALTAKIDRVETRGCLDNFMMFYQALIAYLKYFFMESSSQQAKWGQGYHQGNFQNRGNNNNRY